MVELFLIRHGQTAGNLRVTALGVTDLPLTETGRKQAEVLAEQLKSKNPAAVYTSPLMRAKETAEIVAEPHGLVVCEIPDLMERNFGVWENIAKEDIKEMFPEAYEEWQQNLPDYRMEGGETARENYERVSRATDAILARHQDGSVFIVSHLGSIRNILAHLMGQGVERAWDYHVDNGGFCRLQIETGKNAVLTAFDII